MSLIQISDFTLKVMKQIKLIPVGRVASYKQIAELAGKPQGSRGVAWILHSCSTTYKLPWHRVLNSKGQISFEKKSHNFRKQKKLLENEGVVLNESGQLNLTKFQWKKKAPLKIVNSNQPQIFTIKKKV
jgi:methylated-DNA-protein-cysteine methyltransferase-like protein